MTDRLQTAVDVSVLVPTFNHGAFIAECLDSILGQDYAGSVEVLVGDDCSTDDTYDVAQGLARQHPSVTVLRPERNVGMHANTRNLIAAARGRFVAFCEGDDYWHDPSKLTVQVKVLESDPSLTGVHSDVDHIRFEDGHWRRQQDWWSGLSPFVAPRTTRRDLLRVNSIMTCSVVLRSESVTDYSASPMGRGLYSVEDWPLFIHAASSGDFAFIAKSLATYRHVEGSATNRGHRRELERIQDQFRMLADAAETYPGDRAFATDGMRRTLDALVRRSFRFGDSQEVRRVMGIARDLKVEPTLKTRALALTAALPGLTACVGALSKRWDALQFRRHYR